MSDPAPQIDRDQIDAVIFELDGVVTRTSDLHAEAWKSLLDPYLEQRQLVDGEDPSPFDPSRDYRRYLEGRPRRQGLQHFLAARNIHLPMGEHDDPPQSETVSELARRKDVLLQDLLAKRGIELYGCALALIRSLRRAGFATAVVTASKNCNLVLEQSGIDDLFDVQVDGYLAEHLGLDAKPDPDTLLEAARRLGVEPARAAVVEDSVPGVTAAKRGRFGLVIALDRDARREALLEHGAHQVLTDLCEIEVVDEPTTTASVPTLLQDPQRIADQLADKHPALFLDYDGTLTPIVPHPDEARLSEPMRQLLCDACRRMPVAIVSGRDLDDIRARVGIPELLYAGSHGFEIAGPGLELELPEGVDVLADLDRATEELHTRLAGIQGLRLERKRFAVAAHYREVAERDWPAVRAGVEQVQAELPRLRLTGGKLVYELRPDIDWDKGRAVRWLLTELELDGPDVLPIYIGDDETDEDAFAALHGQGLGILVAEQPQASSADYRVSDTAEVENLLRRLIEKAAASV